MEDDENTSLQAHYLDTYVETGIPGILISSWGLTDSSQGHFRAEAQQKLSQAAKTGSISHFPGGSDTSVFLGKKMRDTVVPPLTFHCLWNIA